MSSPGPCRWPLRPAPPAPPIWTRSLRTPPRGGCTNRRFAALKSGATCRHGIAPSTAGQDEANGAPQLDPRGHGTWGDYLVTISDHMDVPILGSYGNDYIAGGAADDMIFGELGNDTAQGDGSIDYVSHLLNQPTGATDATTLGGRVTAYRTPGGATDVGPLTVYPSFDSSDGTQAAPTAKTDGHDYIAGNGGNDL